MPDSTVHPATVSDPVALLETAFRAAIVAELGDEFAGVDPLIRTSQNPEFGDFQSNVAMSLSKRMGENPHALAQRIASAAAGLLSELADAPEVAGPGFINIRLKPQVLAELLAAMHERDLGIEESEDTHSIVIDMCSVNVAKQMHVGHLRSTIIGDALARVFERLGRTVHRQNHLGDWGLQIGMVLHMLREQDVDLDGLTLAELEQAYRNAQLSCKADHQGLDAAIAFHAGPHRLLAAGRLCGQICAAWLPWLEVAPRPDHVRPKPVRALPDRPGFLVWKRCGRLFHRSGPATPRSVPGVCG